MALGRLEADGCTLWISQQVMREYLAVVTRPQATSRPLPVAAAIADVRRFRASFAMASDNPAVLERLLELLAAHPSAGKQVHDANIVATMQAHDVQRLLTYNTSDFLRFAGIIDLESLPPI
jgi:predicted nucleic acid-binding protein